MADPTSGSFNNRPEKKTKGQKATEMKQIENKTALAVSFCKRRIGLFKKANELCTLCAVQIALIIFSPTAKPYAFGHPDVNSVMEEYLARNGVNVKKLPPDHLNHVRHDATIEKLCDELAEVRKRGKMVGKSGEDLKKIINGNGTKSWWKKSIEDMNISELEECKRVFEELMAIVTACACASSTGGADVDIAL